jgi:hypothetical protein
MWEPSYSGCSHPWVCASSHWWSVTIWRAVCYAATLTGLLWYTSSMLFYSYQFAFRRLLESQDHQLRSWFVKHSVTRQHSFTGCILELYMGSVNSSDLRPENIITTSCSSIWTDWGSYIEDWWWVNYRDVLGMNDNCLFHDLQNSLITYNSSTCPADRNLSSTVVTILAYFNLDWQTHQFKSKFCNSIVSANIRSPITQTPFRAVRC